MSSGDQGRVRVGTANAGSGDPTRVCTTGAGNKADPVLVRISRKEKGMGCTGTDPGKRPRAETWWEPWAERQTSQELRDTGGGHRVSVQR